MDTQDTQYELLGEGPVTCSFGLQVGLLYFVQGKTVTIINLPGNRCFSAELGFVPDRFSEIPTGEGVWITGLEGRALFYGEVKVKEVLSFGPHRIIAGKEAGTGTPDMNGLPLASDLSQLGNIRLEKHWGLPVTACLHRGEVLAAFSGGTVLTYCGQRKTIPFGHQRPTISSHFYVNSSANLIALSLEDRLLYSVDHALSWLEKPTGRWPVYIEGQTYSEREGAVVLER